MTEIQLGQNIDTKDYYTISTVNDKGVAITKKVTPDTPGAVHVKMTLSNGKDYEKWVLHYPNIAGTIKTVQYSENTFGEGKDQKTLKSVNVYFNDDKTVLSFSIGTRYASDFLKKLPNVDIEKTTKFTPFDFTNEQGSTVRGITINQDDKKIENHYWNNEEKKSINGMIEPDEYDKADWTIFYKKVDQFLLSELRKRFPQEQQNKPVEATVTQTPDEIDINELVKDFENHDNEIPKVFEKTK